MALANKVIYQNGAIREFEKPEVCEAIKVANANRWTVGLSPIEWYERKARLKKELEEHDNASDKMGMTLKEAKDILKKEFAVIGIHKSTEPFEFDESRWIEHEKPSVLEAFRVLSKEGYYITISGHDYNMREKRLKKEYEENTKAPGSAENSIKGDLSGNKSVEHYGETIPGSPLSAVECIKLKWKDNRNTSENPALAESASQFNDALLDEQEKKIGEQNKEITRLLSLVEKKENSISRLYYEKSVLEKENEDLKKGEIPARYFDKALVDEQEEKIKKLEHEKLDILEMVSSCKQTIAEHGKKNKRFGKEISRLNKIIHKKNEELRLTKIREKNLTEVGQKYMKENEELKKKLADKVVDKIDDQALKSAESALAYKEKVIAEKDEVIADLGKELAATKKELEEKTKLVEEVRKYSKEYREYGIEAVKMIRKMAKAIVCEKPICSEDFKEYRRLANGYSFNPQLPDFSEEEEKKLTAKTLDFNAKCMRAARESINDVFESYAAKYAKSSLDDLKEKAYESFNAKAHKLGLVGSKDGNGLLNQMAGVDAAEEGADQSGKIVICGKDFGKLLKENEESAEELSKVLNDVIDQFLLFGEIIIKSEK